MAHLSFYFFSSLKRFVPFLASTSDSSSPAYLKRELLQATARSTIRHPETSSFVDITKRGLRLPLPQGRTRGISVKMPMFDSLFQSWRNSLSPLQTLKTAKLQLLAAGEADEDAVALGFCEQAEMSLDRLKKPKSPSAQELLDHPTFCGEVAAAYNEHARFMAYWEYYNKEQASLDKCRKWGGEPRKDGAEPIGKSVGRDCVPIPEHIFAKDIDWLTIIQHKLPEVNKQLSDTPQLAYCLAVLRTAQSSGRELLRDPAALNWFQRIETNKEEHDRLKGLVKSLVRAFTRDELKDADAVAEVTHVAPVLERAEFRFMLKLFVNSLKDSALLEVHSLEGVARLMGSAPCTLEADDLVKTLIHINNILQDTHDQSEEHVYKLISTVSRVLDAMADSHVVGLERVDLHKPLCDYLDGLKNSEDPYMVFQAAYAFQALLRVPDNESNWAATVRKGGRIINSAFQLAGAVKALDVNSFIDGLCKLQTGLKEIYDVAVTVKLAYEEAKSLYGSGDELRAALQEGFSFDRKRTWYTALRGTDSLLRDGQLAQFKTVVCEVPCRRALPFQWGICLRLGNLAVDGQWDDGPRCDAVAFLVELYKDDANWGQHVPVKQLILDILLQLSISAQSKAQVEAKTHLETLKDDGTLEKRRMFRSCEESGPSRHPLMAAMSPPASSALLDRAQGIVDVEADLKRLRFACERQRVEAVYIPPMAKDGLQAPDTDLSDLMEKAQQFLNHKEKKVLLLLGESGVGKSTFNMELEHLLWTQYQKEGRIPLFISLPAIDQPEHDLIAKQLRKLQFEESQIRELRNRTFVLICDGYDESQQTQNLYRKNRLNLGGEWQAQMVISCRTEYLGLDYKDQFQPGDRNKLSDLKQLQEAVVMPFSPDQIKNYIDKFVALEKPLWTAEKYNTVLKTIPSLQELVKNPFLLKVSLDVLPRLVDPEKKNFAATANITRVALYDQFVEQWLERGKKRLVEKGMSDQERKAYEDLSSEGFARNGIAYLKKLAAAIYDNQGGNPVIQYSRIEDEGSWKDKFFGREDEMQLLRDACPLARGGNQYRFIHRSILEYALARAEFEPRHGETGVNKTDESTTTLKRRGSASSAYSFELDGTNTDTAILSDQGLDPKSPLALRSFVGEPSVLQFLEERAQQEPIFEKQLRAYVEASKSDPKWRIAAANAITILVRAGFQFNGADLQSIQIPGADLSFGVFDSAQLQKADLRKVKLSNVWLSKANLSQARMSGVEFGELPHLKQGGAVSRIAYSPDGKALVIVLSQGGVNVYSTTTWEEKWGLTSDLSVDPGVLISPNSDLIAYFLQKNRYQIKSARTRANVVHIHEFKTGKSRHTLLGHTKEVTGITYSPRGDLLASCSSDKTIRLWDVENGTCHRILEGSIDGIVCVSFSPSGHQIASGGDVEYFPPSGHQIASGDVDYVSPSGHQIASGDVDYVSPSGHQIASGGDVNYLARLWDVETGVSSTISVSGPRVPRVSFEQDYIKRIVYSANGSRIAFCTSNTTVQLLDAESREHIGGHLSAQPNSFEFSPSGDTCAGIYEQAQVHIWSTETGKPRHVLETNHGKYLDMAFTRKGDLIITGGEDRIVRLWDVETGVCRGSLGGYTDGIRRVALPSEGRHIASAGDDGVLRLWEVELGMARTTSSGFGCTVLSVGHSPNGASIISVNGGSTVNTWNMQSGECSQYLTEHGEKACSVALSPCGGWIACGTTGSNIQLKSLEGGNYCSVLSDVEGRNEAVNSIAYSPKSDRIASCSNDGSVKIRDAGTGDRLHLFSGHLEWRPDPRITHFAYSPTAQQFATITFDAETFTLWDVKVGTCRILQGHSDSISCITYSPTGEEIASASNDMTIRLWNTTSGVCRLILRVSGCDIQALYSPNGCEIVAWYRDNTIHFWNTQTGDCRSTLTSKTCRRLSDIAYSPIGTVIASTDSDGTVQLWNVESGDCQTTLQYDLDAEKEIGKCCDAVTEISCSKCSDTDDSSGQLGHISRGSGVARLSRKQKQRGSVTYICFSPRGDLVATYGKNVEVVLWNVLTRKHRRTFHAVNGCVAKPVFSPNGSRIVYAYSTTAVRVWDVDTGACLHTLDHETAFDAVVYSPKGDLIASGTCDKTVKLWDAESGICLHTLYGNSYRASCLAFSPKGDGIIARDGDNIFGLWDTTSGTLSRHLRGHTGAVNCVAFSPNGRLVASGSRDNSIWLWDLDTASSWRTLLGHTGSVMCVTFSPAGNHIASGSEDESIRLWDIKAGTCLTRTTEGMGKILCLAFSPDGEWVAAGSSGMSVWLWNIASDQTPWAVIEGGYENITSIAWRTADNTSYLITGCSDSSVRVWRIIQEDGNPRSATLHWSSSHRALFVANCNLQGVKGLSGVNKRLLKQRNASGEPESPLTLNEASTVALAASRFRRSGKTGMDSSTFASPVPQDVALEE